MGINENVVDIEQLTDDLLLQQIKTAGYETNTEEVLAMRLESADARIRELSEALETIKRVISNLY